MPCYEYFCNDCQKVFEMLRPISESSLSGKCSCGRNAKRIISQFRTEGVFTPYYHEGLDKTITSHSDLNKEMKRQNVVTVMDSRKARNAAEARMSRVMSKNKNPEFLKKADKFLKALH
jgi:putative FmdB family regulatory protein